MPELQRNVVAGMRSLGLKPKEEESQSGYSLDALVEFMVQLNGEKIGVEVDGRSHFLGVVACQMAKQCSSADKLLPLIRFGSFLCCIGDGMEKIE